MSLKETKEHTSPQTDLIMSKTILPPKKRFKIEVDEIKKEPETEKKIKEEKDECGGKGTILPGVIRHTSCPDHSIAYVFRCN